MLIIWILVLVAKENKYGFRIVTIQGDIINASGAITGGSVAQKTVNILGRGREIENLAKEIKVLQNKISEKQREVNKIMKNLFQSLLKIQKN